MFTVKLMVAYFGNNYYSILFYFCHETIHPYYLCVIEKYFPLFIYRASETPICLCHDAIVAMESCYLEMYFLKPFYWFSMFYCEFSAFIRAVDLFFSTFSLEYVTFCFLFLLPKHNSWRFMKRSVDFMNCNCQFFNFFWNYRIMVDFDP